MAHTQDLRDELGRLVEQNVKSIVEDPDDVTIKVVPIGRNKVAVEIFTNENDVALVMGKQAATLGAIRRLAWSFGGKHDFAVEVEYPTEQDTRQQHRRD